MYLDGNLQGGVYEASREGPAAHVITRFRCIAQAHPMHILKTCSFLDQLCYQRLVT